MSNSFAFRLFLFTLLLGLSTSLGNAAGPDKDEAGEAVEAAESDGDQDGKGQEEVTATTNKTDEDTSVAESNAISEREETIATRIRELVKRFDAADRVGKTFPVKAIERAVRGEFMRRTEGKNGISWLPASKLRESDTLVAQDNLELLLTYTERLLTLTKANKKYSKKEEEEMKCLAAKAVIDEYNTRRSNRAVASFSGTSVGLSALGKNELTRRRKLVGGMVAGDDYKPIAAKKIDDIGKAYKQNLMAAVKEYEMLGNAVNKQRGPATSAPAKKGGKKRK